MNEYLQKHKRTKHGTGNKQRGIKYGTLFTRLLCNIHLTDINSWNNLKRDET